jgi:FtsP/CotA-like multicopper oxidase with cupredoxin domain
VIALDGRPAAPFLLARGLLAPGNRLDVVVDVTAPTRVVVGHPDGTGTALSLAVDEGQPARTAALPAPALPAPDDLPRAIPFLKALRREIVAGEPPGQALPPFGERRPPPLFTARKGQTILLALVNRLNVPRAFTIHGQAVRLLDTLDDGWKPFWLDTVPVAPEATARIAFVPDRPGAFAITSQAMREAPADPPAWFDIQP